MDNFLDCQLKQGSYFAARQNDLSDNGSETNSDTDEAENMCKRGDDRSEQYELRAHTVVNTVEKNTIIAMYSEPNSFELLYLCKVILSV